jgi:hypothetical protein
MKLIRLSIATILLVGVGIMVACEEEKFEREISEQSTLIVGEEGTQKLFNDGLGAETFAWYPNGTIITYDNDHEMSVKVPEGWKYVYKELGDGEEIPARMSGGGGGGISCDCTSGSGCHPFVDIRGNGGGGCLVSVECKSCNKSITVSYTLDGVLKEFEVSKGGYVNLNQGVTFARLDQTLPAVFEEMYDIPEVVEGIQEFIDEVQAGSNPEPLVDGYYLLAPDGYVFAAINVFGRATTILVSNDVAESYNLAISGVSSVRLGCTCTEGSGNCEIMKLSGGWACVVSGDCKSCSATLSNTFQISSYRY